MSEPIKLTPEHRKFLRDTQPYRQQLIDTGCVTGMNLHRQLHIYRQYWNSDYPLDLTCYPDVVRFIKTLEQLWQEYEKDNPRKLIRVPKVKSAE